MRERPAARDTRRAPRLLHNMSCRPNVELDHRSPHRRLHGPALSFRLPVEFDAGLENVVRAFVSVKERRSLEEARRELCRRMNEHAGGLALPAAALVTEKAERGDLEERDLFTILTVLAKSSGRVYLRDKEPDLGLLVPGRRVILIVANNRQGRLASEREEEP